MNKISWSLGIIIFFLIDHSLASEINNVSDEMVYETNIIYITSTIRSQKFIDRWTEELVPAGSKIIYDRYGPPSSFNWIRKYDTELYGIHEYMSSEGEDAVFSIMSAAAREAAVSTLPIDEYEHSGRTWIGNILPNFVHGSIGNTDEEGDRAVSSTPSYSTLKHIIQFEWNDHEDIWDGQYGWRPWRDNPYVYLDNNFGHYQGRQLLRTEFRCYGYLRPNSFGLIKTEARAIISISKGSQLVLGGHSYPFENKEKYRSECSVRLETYWKGSIFSAGVISIENGPYYWNIMYEFRF